MKTLYKIFIFGLFLTLGNCSKEDTTKPTPTITYTYKTEKQLIEDTTNTIILPAITSFKNECTKLNNLTNTYINNLSVNNLNLVKNQWKIVAESYASIYAFNIGDIKGNYMRQRLYNWPSTTIAIENFIKDKEITKNNISNFGSSAKGISAIEYLLYKNTANEVNTEMINSTKRVKYLQLITEELKENTDKQENLWKTYAKTLINNTETSGLNSSLNIIFNGLNNVVTFARETKIGKPSGLEKSNHTNVETLQAFYSETSLKLIRKNLESVENALFKTGTTTIGDKISFITKDEKLNDALKNQFKKIYNAIDAINSPLKTAIGSDIEKVKKLHSELKLLEVLFISDVRSALSLIITGTDGDGD